MAKAIALVSAVCILALASVAQSHPSNGFNVSGKVYCDPCRVQFEHQFSYHLPGATVRISCFNNLTETITYTAEGVTDKTGYYDLRVKGDHHNDLCEVRATKSPKPECSVKMFHAERHYFKQSADNLVQDLKPLGFMTKGVLPGCSIVEKMG
ncbi:hypothetical protein ACJIZ3_011166 [Penstemon smallii]|uniref:Uncharacterized protein n=1 Tax=Penstemon smallii TaxID=265156 RepID=A0ABD3UID5_9LAMI